VIQGHRYGDPSRRRGNDALALPLVVDDQLCGAVALEVEHRPEPELRKILELLQWGAAGLENLVRRRSFTARDRLVTVLELLATSLQHDRFQASSTAAATELAGILNCERVSIGFLRRRHVRVKALSNSASFGKKANVIRAIEAAMDEAVDQEATVVYPPVQDGPFQVVREHEALCKGHGAESVCTVPFSEGDRFLGALVLERPDGEYFDRDTVQFCEHAAALLGPVLDVKRRDDRWLLQKAFDSLGSLLQNLFGPRHLGLKLGTLGAIALIAFFTFAEGDYRITADATLEGTIQRAIAAPMRGYVSVASVRAGDVVREGQVLASLDDRDMRLERLKWTSQKAQRSNEYREALASHDRAQVRILGSQIQQADAQIALIDEQLERSRIVAPFDGIVVAGDLSQSLGAPVERGDVLFQVAPLDAYRIILEVDEREIAPVQIGQKGELALAGSPDETLPMVVQNITPVSAAEEGANLFRVEASLDAESLVKLRPGMEGVGKIYVDERKIAWIWSHKIVHWMRMFFWRWWP
jgi:RND family efflux transporter MFP subunit